MSSSTITAKESYEPVKTTDTLTRPQSSAMSDHSSVRGTPTAIREWLIASSRPLPVKASASQANNLQERTPGINGPPRLTCYAEFSPDSSSWRTSQGSFLGVMDISDAFSETWPRSGSMLDGRCYPLRTSEPPIFGRGFGLWPTPTACDWKGSGVNAKCFDLLDFAIERGKTKSRDRFPTATAGDAHGGGSRNTATSKAKPGVSLTDYVLGDGGKGRDPDVKGRLNPDWVEWLMNWPIGWTLLDPLEDLGRWGSADWWNDEQDIPRTTTTKKDRAARLRALGNGWVPLCGAVAYRQLTKETT